MNAELQVRKTIQEHNLIAAGDTVILGLSGGPDSLCLQVMIRPETQLLYIFPGSETIYLITVCSHPESP